jgi:hypothetical protein
MPYTITYGEADEDMKTIEDLSLGEAVEKAHVLQDAGRRFHITDEAGEECDLEEMERAAK